MSIVCKLCGEPITAARLEIRGGTAKKSWLGPHETRDRVHTACGEAWHAAWRAEQEANGVVIGAVIGRRGR